MGFSLFSGFVVSLLYGSAQSESRLALRLGALGGFLWAGPGRAGRPGYKGTFSSASGCRQRGRRPLPTVPQKNVAQAELLLTQAWQRSIEVLLGGVALARLPGIAPGRA